MEDFRTWITSQKIVSTMSLMTFWMVVQMHGIILYITIISTLDYEYYSLYKYKYTWTWLFLFRFFLKCSIHVQICILDCYSNNRRLPSLIINAWKGIIKCIWLENIPSKIKIFAWKVCMNLLPTVSNLMAKCLIPGSLSCVHCRAPYGRHKTCAFTLQLGSWFIG